MPGSRPTAKLATEPPPQPLLSLSFLMNANAAFRSSSPPQQSCGEKEACAATIVHARAVVRGPYYEGRTARAVLRQWHSILRLSRGSY